VHAIETYKRLKDIMRKLWKKLIILSKEGARRGKKKLPALLKGVV